MFQTQNSTRCEIQTKNAMHREIYFTGLISEPSRLKNPFSGQKLDFWRSKLALLDNPTYNRWKPIFNLPSDTEEYNIPLLKSHWFKTAKLHHPRLVQTHLQSAVFQK